MKFYTFYDDKSTILKNRLNISKIRVIYFLELFLFGTNIIILALTFSFVKLFSIGGNANNLKVMYST